MPRLKINLFGVNCKIKLNTKVQASSHLESNPGFEPPALKVIFCPQKSSELKLLEAEVEVKTEFIKRKK